MIEGIALVLMACFCVIAGYLLGFLQQAVHLLQEISRKLDKETPSGDLPPGMYAFGQPDKMGASPLIPMQKR